MLNATMLFRETASGVLAISQPAHAWISGQILADWNPPLPRSLVLAGEQHDIAWLDWERAPGFDPTTNRPFLFRAVGAAAHAPMWAAGVERALHAWGMHPALMISRHGGVIYRRFTDRHRLNPADALAAERFLREQAPREAAWAEALGLDDAALARHSELIAFADTLSLAFCGELVTPLAIEAPGYGSITVSMEDEEVPSFTLSPWPFRTERVCFEAEARILPPPGRLPSEDAMRCWLADDANRVTFRVAARGLQ